MLPVLARHHRHLARLADAGWTIGLVWIAAGVLRELFGLRITFPLLPSLGLEHVASWAAIRTGLAWVAGGAVLGRLARVAAAAAPGGVDDSTTTGIVRRLAARRPWEGRDTSPPATGDADPLRVRTPA